MLILIVILVIGSFVSGYFVGRNNPSLGAVNKLISVGKAVVDKTGKVVAAIKS